MKGEAFFELSLSADKQILQNEFNYHRTPPQKFQLGKTNFYHRRGE